MSEPKLFEQLRNASRPTETRNALAELAKLRPELALFLQASRDASCEEREAIPGLLSSDDALFCVWCIWHGYLKDRKDGQ